MSLLTPMFNKYKTIKVEDSNKRTIRSDKKNQVKVPVTSEQKLEIAKLSFSEGHRGEIHSYLADVFTKSVDRDFIIHATPKEYSDTGIYVSTKVPKAVHEELLKLKVEWGLRSVKRAAHRILLNELGL
ncbi:hypothetical protein [Sutcliffiella halmapala]|uniref:hypothetical protein n=1 Tax=Sutcliffiella halmapala TaxID=79882 RepID=UPI000994B8C6|nr:hypothetical protein [Sutcliffiella halmapala]